jgi:hypothetical protein
MFSLEKRHLANLLLLIFFKENYFLFNFLLLFKLYKTMTKNNINKSTYNLLGVEDPLVLHPWYVVNFSTLRNLLASADVAALWDCLGCGGIVGFGLMDLDGMGVFHGNICIYLWRGRGHMEL